MTTDILLTVLNVVWGLILTGIGIEMVNNPPGDDPTKKWLYRSLFGVFGAAVIITTFFQSTRNATEQARLRDEAKTEEGKLSDQLSNANGKLDAIGRFEGQFLALLSQQRSGTSDASTRAYMTAILGIMKAAGSGKQPTPKERMLQLSNDIYGFVGDRSSVQPQPEGVASTQFTQQYHEWWKDTDDQYIARFAPRVSVALNEAKGSGIDTFDADSSCLTAATPSLGGIHEHFTAIQNCGKHLGVIGGKMNF